MSSNVIVAVLFVVLFALVVTALAMCVVAKACDDWQGDLDADGEPHAQLVDDVHLAKVARIADAMKADREKAFADYLQTPSNVMPIIRDSV